MNGFDLFFTNEWMHSLLKLVYEQQQSVLCNAKIKKDIYKYWMYSWLKVDA